MDNFNQNKKLDAANVASDLSAFSQLLSGISNIFSPAAQAQQQTEDDTQKLKDKRNFNIFLIVATVVVLGLLGYIIYPKTK